MQVEEQLRNSVMLDLLYVNCAHALAPHIFTYYQLYHQVAPYQRPVWPIDSNAWLVNALMVNIHELWLVSNQAHLFLVIFVSSGGMNGYLWLYERNELRPVVSSPINGLPDIECNQVL